MKIFNPATEELIREVETDSSGSLQEKLDLLRGGLASWRRLSIERRVHPFLKFGELLEKNRETLARTLTLEMGKPIRESQNELAGAGGRVRFFVEQAASILRTRTVHEESGMKELLSFDPLGVVAHISPWNYPYLVGMNILPPALIAGNAVLYKPSEFATLTGLEISKLLWEAGVPQEVFQPVIGAGDIGELLLELPLDGFFFTGSYRTGRRIAEVVGPKMVPIGMELGGKDPLYIAEDSEDIGSVAAAAVEGAFYNNGQSCCAVERIYLHKGVYDTFLKEFLKRVKKLRVGDPLDPLTTQGPLARPVHLDFLSSQVNDALSKGGTLLAGGKRIGKRGAFFEPTVFADANHSMSLMKEETFGPVIGIQKVVDDDEAIRWMNDTDYGLTASVFSEDEGRARKILGQIDVGTGYWNCCDRVSPNLPWSGRKHSGFGWTLSDLGFFPFIRPKAFHLRRP